MIQTFDDFLLIPEYSEIEHNEVDITAEFFGQHLEVPVLSSPMDTVSGIEMLKAMILGGGLGVHHRYCNFNVLQEASYFGAVAVSPSMGITAIYDFLNYGNPILVLDVAHGHTKRNLKFCEELTKIGFNKIVSGNIVNPQAALDYWNVGVKYMRVGFGNGSVCTTRLVTGCGYPQAKAIHEIDKVRWGDKKDIKIISDGGCKTTGDIVKALFLGADFVMLGGMLAGTNEAISQSEYRGMASNSALSERKKEFFVEGIEKKIGSKGSVVSVLRNIKDAIEQACYYTGSRNLEELRNSGYIELSDGAKQESYVR